MTNKFLVGVGGDSIAITKPVPPIMSKADALNLAAWLVALADDKEEFRELLEECLSS